MPRINYTHTYDDGTTVQGVFDSACAEEWEGNDTDPDSDMGTEYLYRTDGEMWIVNTLSGGHEGSQYMTLTDEQARLWLYENGYPEDATNYFRTGPGRPVVGEAVDVSVPRSMLTQIDRIAEHLAVQRPKAIRLLLDAALKTHTAFTPLIDTTE